MFVDYYNPGFGFSFNQSKKYSLIQCDYDVLFDKFILVDIVKGSCYEPNLENNIRLYFQVGSQKALTDIYNNFEENQLSIYNIRPWEGRSYKEKFINGEKIIKFYFNLQQDRGLLFTYEGLNNSASQDLFWQIINSLRVY